MCLLGIEHLFIYEALKNVSVTPTKNSLSYAHCLSTAMERTYKHLTLWQHTVLIQATVLTAITNTRRSFQFIEVTIDK